MSPLTHILPEPGRKFNGLLVYLSRPNRYDTANGRLLSGPPGDFLRDVLRRCDYDPEETCYTTEQMYRPPGQMVKRTLLLGATAHKIRGRGDRSASIADVRGWCEFDTITTFDPVDCCDVVDHEHGFNDSDDDDDIDASSTNKDSAPTMRRNYRFWFEADVRKLLCNERRSTYKYLVQRVNSVSLIRWLESQNNTLLFFDIETHPPTNSVQCFSIAAPTGPVLTISLYDYRGSGAPMLPQLFAALARAFTRNTVVGHNITFDLGFLFHFHGVPFSHRLYDTMLAQHRCFPEAEKSLAHTMSYWLNVSAHKSVAHTFTPYNISQQNTLLEYNSCDVLVLREIYAAQQAYAATDSGLQASIEQVNAVAYDYLLAGLTGITINNIALHNRKRELAATLEQLTRVMRILVGEAEFNPGSGQQISVWLYDGLNYVVFDRTETGAPKTDIQTLYKQLLKHPDNVALRVLLMYKKLAKDAGMLDFKPYYINEERRAV